MILRILKRSQVAWPALSHTKPCPPSTQRAVVATQGDWDGGTGRLRSLQRSGNIAETFWRHFMKIENFDFVDFRKI